MKKNTRLLIRQMVLIAAIGLAVALLGGEYEWSYTVNPLAGLELQDALRYLNLGLPFLVLTVGLGVGIYFLLRKGDE